MLMTQQVCASFCKLLQIFATFSLRILLQHLFHFQPILHAGAAYLLHVLRYDWKMCSRISMETKAGSRPNPNLTLTLIYHYTSPV